MSIRDAGGSGHRTVTSTVGAPYVVIMDELHHAPMDTYQAPLRHVRPV